MRAAVTGLLLVVSSGCSLVIDKNETQCKTDADCEQYGNHPTCSSDGVCVDSGLGPPDCFFGTPQTQADFANQCTTSKYDSFDNCARLGLCSDAQLENALNTATTPANLGSIPPPINTEPTPTQMCSALDAAPIYITGSTNLPPLIKAVQPLLYASSPQYIAVFEPQTSCKGADSIYSADTTKHVIKNITQNYAFYYDRSGNQTFCLLDDTGNTVDVGESDVFPVSCDASYTERPGIANYTGPIQAITFVVPSASSQTAISAEAAHLAFATGGNSNTTMPWVDPTLYFVRSSGTGTTQLPSRAIGLDPKGWWGLDRLSASNLVASMEAIDPTVAEKAIGVLSNDFADRSRANLRMLAFQQHGQKFAYLPDSSIESRDKANVRDGHYPIWGPVHLLAATTGGVPSQAASALITQFSVPKLDEGLVTAIIGAGFVPGCAMKVQRSAEVGPLSAYQPPFGCGCFFDKQVNGATSCQACAGPADCDSAHPACNYGYCEVK